jgi:hypothetical protein
MVEEENDKTPPEIKKITGDQPKSHRKKYI